MMFSSFDLIFANTISSHYNEHWYVVIIKQHFQSQRTDYLCILGPTINKIVKTLLYNCYHLRDECNANEQKIPRVTMLKVRYLYMTVITEHNFPACWGGGGGRFCRPNTRYRKYSLSPKLQPGIFNMKSYTFWNYNYFSIPVSQDPVRFDSVVTKKQGFILFYEKHYLRSLSFISGHLNILGIIMNDTTVQRGRFTSIFNFMHTIMLWKGIQNGHILTCNNKTNDNYDNCNRWSIAITTMAIETKQQHPFQSI